MSNDISILGGLVEIRDEPFTSVFITASRFERWPPERIAEYYRDLAKWRTWGWLRFMPGWDWWAPKFGIPVTEPNDRLRVIEGSVVLDGSRVGAYLDPTTRVERRAA